MRKVKLLTVVVPCFNEQEVLPLTYIRLVYVLNDLIRCEKIFAYELIFVDNGSTDETLKVLKNLFEKDDHIRIVSLRRNFGYQGSITAGLFHARGDIVVTIDADLQDPPEKISEMITFFQEGYDLVLGVREDRSSDSLLKRLFSNIYYRLLKIMGVDVVSNHGDFRLMAKSLVDEFNAMTERNRFIRAMILQLESKYAIVSYKREPRIAGKTKFNISELFSFSFDGIISFSFFPLRLASIVGSILFICSTISALWVLYIKLLTVRSIPGWASTLVPILGLGGMQLFFLGIIGEYIGRLYVEVKQRPLFTVREEFSHEKKYD